MFDIFTKWNLILIVSFITVSCFLVWICRKAQRSPYSDLGRFGGILLGHLTDHSRISDIGPPITWKNSYGGRTAGEEGKAEETAPASIYQKSKDLFGRKARLQVQLLWNAFGKEFNQLRCWSHHSLITRRKRLGRHCWGTKSAISLHLLPSAQDTERKHIMLR